MASFGLLMPIAGEGTTIAGVCHLGVLSIVEEERACTDDGIDGEMPTL
jgi:hypothetical protein